jgi:hypothetical protein
MTDFAWLMLFMSVAAVSLAAVAVAAFWAATRADDREIRDRGEPGTDRYG